MNGKIFVLALGLCASAAYAEEPVSATADKAGNDFDQAGKELGKGHVVEGFTAIGHGFRDGAITTGHAVRNGARAAGKAMEGDGKGGKAAEKDKDDAPHGPR